MGIQSHDLYGEKRKRAELICFCRGCRGRGAPPLPAQSLSAGSRVGYESLKILVFQNQVEKFGGEKAMGVGLGHTLDALYSGVTLTGIGG